MTLQQLLDILSAHPIPVIVYFAALPLACLLLRLFHGRGGGGAAPWRYVYTVVIYLVCIPGIFSLFLTLYSLLLLRASILTVNVLSYFLPILSMAVSLLILRRSVAFDDIPGFRRLYGLFLLIFLTFLVLFALDRLRILLLFHASIFLFLGLGIVIFFALKYASRLLLGRFGRR